MKTLLNTTKSLTCLCLVSIIIPLQSSHADVYKTSTGHCIVTSKQYMEGSYQDPTSGKYWKYAPCNSTQAQEQSQTSNNSTNKKRTPNSPAVARLKGSFRDLISGIRDKLETCLPFSAGSCSRAPDTIPVEWLPPGTQAGGLAWRVTHDRDSGKMQLNPNTQTLFPRIVKKNKSGGFYVDFEKTAKVCQAFQNDPRYVTEKGELSRQPARHSILNNYNAYTQLSALCHELIHMGECASCLSPIGSEKEAYEFEQKAARSAAQFAPKATKALFAAYAADRAAFVSYMTCRETSDNATCVAACQKAGHAAERCTTAGQFYGQMGTQTIGHKHEDEKQITLGTLTANDLTSTGNSGNTADTNSTNGSSSQGSSLEDKEEPSGAITKFSLGDGTVFTCPSGNVGFRVVGSDSIERGYCCPAGSSTVTVGTNLQGQCA